jgi:hypothetical protein
VGRGSAARSGRPPTALGEIAAAGRAGALAAATAGASNSAAQAALAGPEQILLTVILGDLD